MMGFKKNVDGKIETTYYNTGLGVKEGVQTAKAEENKLLV